MKVATVTGIRPDFIRMSEIFRRLDDKFEHVLIHTGQHYDNLLSGVFFDELDIRAPDFNLQLGGAGVSHYQFRAGLAASVVPLIRDIGAKLVLFLGDSNSILAAVDLHKDGILVGHIEAGMRSYDRRMLEEINRVVCDHCSDLLFVYHEDYKNNCVKENIDPSTVHVVGNTIVEVCNKYARDFFLSPKSHAHIILDVHRPENFNYSDRLYQIFAFARFCSKHYGLPVKLVSFARAFSKITEFGVDLSGFEIIPCMPFKRYLRMQYDAKIIISDSGTAQEEAALLNTAVFVPRDFTERPQSVDNNCSYMVNVNNRNVDWEAAVEWGDATLSGSISIDSSWLGSGHTADKIISILSNIT